MPEKKSASPRSVKLPLISLLILLLLAAAAAIWITSGRLSFDGVLRHQTVAVPVPGGLIAAVEVREGEAVKRGQILLRLDTAELNKRLLQERQNLTQLSLALSPQHMPVPADGGQEFLTDRLDRRRQAEEAAERRLQAATDKEAQASIIYNRASAMARRGKLPQEQRDAAEAALEAARQEAKAAREAFESFSLSRAETSADIRRLRELQNRSGADKLPVDARLAAYEQARQRIAASEAAVAAAAVLAPEDGLVVSLAVRSGQRTEPMQTGLVLLPSGRMPLVAARVPAEVASRLEAGRPCRVTLTEPERKEYDGYVAAVLPVGDASAGSAVGGQAQSAASVVRVILLPGSGSGANALSLLTHVNGVKAEITAYLREPLVSVAPSPPASQSAAPAEQWTEAAPPAPPGQAASPSSPLSVQTPFGAEPEPQAPAAAQERREAPVVKAGSQDAGARSPTANGKEAGRPEVSLPPMRAPEELTGSPLPDPRNNPGIAKPEDLDREGAAPR